MSKWDDLDDLGRATALVVSGFVPHDKAQGLVLLAGIAITGYVVNTAYAVEQIVTLPFKVIGALRG